MTSAPPKPILGIDLGTTHVSMAVLEDDGRARVVPNAEGGDTTPAAVHFYDAEGAVVGEEAVKVAVLEAEHVVLGIPGYLGTATGRFPFYGKVWTAQELTGLVLRKLKEDAEELRGEPMEQAVLCVPGWYDSAQRTAARQAAELAGLEPLSLVQPSIAACLAHGLDDLPEPATLVVVDVGGRSTEVGVLRKEGQTLTVQASAADTRLGGRDWEQRIEDNLAMEYQEWFGYDPRKSPPSYQELRLSSRFALHTLQRRPFAGLQVGPATQRMKLRVERRSFLEWTWDLVHKVVGVARTALHKADRSLEDVDEILLVGGASRIPGLHEALERYAGRPVRLTEDAPTLIARGTALAAVLAHQPDHPGLTAAPPPERPTAPTPAPMTPAPAPPTRRRAATLGLADGGHLDGTPPPPSPAPAPTSTAPVRAPSPEPAPGGPAAEPRAQTTPPAHASSGEHLKGLALRQSTTRTLGIIVLDRRRQERVVELIPEGTPLPVRFHGRFAYAYQNMTAVRIEVTEGQGRSRDEVSVIGVVELAGLPPRPRGTPIDVTYHYGLDQVLEVRVIDVESGMWKRAQLTFRGALSEDELRRAKTRSDTIHLE